MMNANIDLGLMMESPEEYKAVHISILKAIFCREKVTILLIQPCSLFRTFVFLHSDLFRVLCFACPPMAEISELPACLGQVQTFLSEMTLKQASTTLES